LTGHGQNIDGHFLQRVTYSVFKGPRMRTGGSIDNWISQS